MFISISISIKISLKIFLQIKSTINIGIEPITKMEWLTIK